MMKWHQQDLFWRGLLVGLVLSLLTSSAWLLCGTTCSYTPFFSTLIIGVASFIYIRFLINRSERRAGRVLFVFVWLSITALLAFGNVSLSLVVLIYSALIWLVRSFYFHRGALAVIMDGVVSVAAWQAGFAVLRSSGSFFLATWCYFLVQSLFALLPLWFHSTKPALVNSASNNRFEQSYGHAEQALRQLISK